MFNLMLSDLQKLPRRNVNGQRLYETPDGSFYPSVTTITGQMTKKAITEWRARVGEKEANRVSKAASSRGTSIHKLCEQYVLNQMDDVKVMPSNKEMFDAMSNHLRDHVDNIHGVESFLYSDFLRTAGQVDCIAEYDNELAIIDFKTSTKFKREEWVQDYFSQETAYAIMFQELTGVKVKQLVTIIACLLYTSPSPRDVEESRMPSSA